MQPIGFDLVGKYQISAQHFFLGEENDELLLEKVRKIGKTSFDDKDKKEFHAKLDGLIVLEEVGYHLSNPATTT